MAGNVNAFQALGDGIVLAATASSQQAAFAGNGDCVAVSNEGTGHAYLSFGKDNTVSVATAWQHAIPPGWRAVIWCGQQARFVAYKASVAGPGNVNLTRGEGIG